MDEAMVSMSNLQIVYFVLQVIFHFTDADVELLRRC